MRERVKILIQEVKGTNMAEVTTQQRLTYWKSKIGIGSVWLLQEFNTSYLTVQGVSYNKRLDSIMVDCVRKDSPGLISSVEVGFFLEHLVHSRVK